MTRNYLDSRYDSCVKGQGQNNEILVVWLVKQKSLTCIDIGGLFFAH